MTTPAQATAILAAVRRNLVLILFLAILAVQGAILLELQAIRDQIIISSPQPSCGAVRPCMVELSEYTIETLAGRIRR